ncbi:hypothetical protein [Streptomyces sp. NBC_00063]|uniref:hypothetical protein n=1 Tax=Streptomyces sp. NBC_00063 TaxID=2975638 RepID=UPI003D708A1F
MRASRGGRWPVLLVTVPKTERDLRRRVRTQLTWAGFGSPDPGCGFTERLEATDVVTHSRCGGS